jgi:carbamoyltransferase
VGAPIAQTPAQVLEALRRAKGLDGVFIFSEEGPVAVAWVRQPQSGAGSRIRAWLAERKSRHQRRVVPELG